MEYLPFALKLDTTSDVQMFWNVISTILPCVEPSSLTSPHASHKQFTALVGHFSLNPPFSYRKLNIGPCEAILPACKTQKFFTRITSRESLDF